MLNHAHRNLGKHIKIQLSRDQLAGVQALAVEAGVSVAAVVRECIEKCLDDIWDSADALAKARKSR